MFRDYDVVIEQDAEGYFVASVPALPGCHTQARSLDALMDRIREAIEVYLSEEHPESVTEFRGIQRVRVAM